MQGLAFYLKEVLSSNIVHSCPALRAKSAFFLSREVLGRVLLPAKGEGNEMAQWLLKTNGNVVCRRTTRPLNKLELSSEIEKRKRNVFDELEQHNGAPLSLPNLQTMKKILIHIRTMLKRIH